ncbi:MAG: carbohydrate kinase [Firmicutes bacterium]|nr:carbohydrate kinase [Bacillota bacterium]
MFDIITVGEILIDLTQSGKNEYGIPIYTANPGGAPANLSVAASRLGVKTAFIGKVGRDSFGELLRATLAADNVDDSGLVTDEKEMTTLAVVSLDIRGERSFAFYRDPSADVNLKISDINEDMLKQTKILHFGSVSLTTEPSRSTTLYAAKKAKEAGAIISYDPNYRDRLWSERGHAIVQMKEPLPMVDILKISNEELPLLSGSSDPLEGSKILHEQYGIKLIFVTLGADGALFRYGDITGQIPCPPIVVGDTNGAGDTFFGAALSKICRLPSLDGLDEETLRAITTFANKAASITTSRHGAIPAMPRLSEVE